MTENSSLTSKVTEEEERLLIILPRAINTSDGQHTVDETKPDAIEYVPAFFISVIGIYTLCFQSDVSMLCIMKSLLDIYIEYPIL
jgi:hypothetical protein